MNHGFVDTMTNIIASRQDFADGYAYLARALHAELNPGVHRRGKIPNVAEQFLLQPDRVEVLDITYAPGDPKMLSSIDPAKPKYNRWKPTTATPDTSVAEADIKPWLDHLLFILGSIHERDRFLRWCAFVAQHPARKPNWHYLIIAVQGLGKDTMVAPIKLAVGAGNWCEDLIYELGKEFNDFVEHKFLIVGETSQPKTGFISAHDYSNRLKPILAQPPDELSINRKYQTKYSIPNRCAVILFSNEDNPLYLERGQRRVHVVNRKAQKAGELDYYWALHDWLRKGGVEKAASFLLAYPLAEVATREFIGGVAPESDDKTKLENTNINSHQSALEDVIRDIRDGIVDDRTPKVPVASAEELAGFIEARGFRNRPTPQQMRNWLIDMEEQGKGVKRLKINPKEPHLCGVVSDGKHSGRLWLLALTAPGGVEWSTLTIAQIIAMWKNLPMPSSATILTFPDSGDSGEEPV
jgi:hypothetical protein